jgi:hypothetical protein
VTVEIQDVDAEFLTKKYNLNIELFVNNMVAVIIANMKEISLAVEAGLELTLDEVRKRGTEVAEQLLKESRPLDKEK